MIWDENCNDDVLIEKSSKDKKKQAKTAENIDIPPLEDSHNIDYVFYHYCQLNGIWKS